MNKLVLVLLFLSLASNVFLAINGSKATKAFQYYDLAEEKDAVLRQMSSESDNLQSNFGRSKEKVLSTIESYIEGDSVDVEELIRLLESVGLPVGLVRSIARAAIHEKYSSELSAAIELDSADGKFWTRRNSFLGGSAYFEITDKISNELDAIDELFRTRPSDFETTLLRTQYGGLSIEKIFEVQRLQRDHLASRKKVLLQIDSEKRLTEEEIQRERMNVYRSVEESMASSIRDLLSDSEFRDWELRHSPSAHEVMSTIEGEEVDLETYKVLVDLRSDFDAEHRYYSDDPVTRQKGKLAWIKYLGESATLLQGDLGVGFLEDNSALYAEIKVTLNDDVGDKTILVSSLISSMIGSHTKDSPDFEQRLYRDLPLVIGEEAAVRVAYNEVMQKEIRTISSMLNTVLK